MVENSDKDSSLERPDTLSKKGTLHFLIIDCSAMVYCDYMATIAFSEIAKDCKDKGGILYIAGANGE
ncbi:hypothetical protein ANCDUO_04776 [Ancylostoma duodenale]|uniref:STAS domain-containing protein n=1 Tax=Ancylostoma duodenale TaxID=51022 RepID=A0A0C2GU82_9BILA|nr:hypothetical protein ANCDUO_04776 [Ancylostoma duodenale]